MKLRFTAFTALAAALMLMPAGCGGEDGATGERPSFPEAKRIDFPFVEGAGRAFLLSEHPEGDAWLVTHGDSSGALRLLWTTDPFAADPGWREVFAGVTGDADGVFRPSGTSFLFMSFARHGDDGGDHLDLYEAPWTDEGAGSPVPLQALNTDGSEVFATATAEGQIVFAATREDGTGGNDIYMARPEADGFRIEEIEGINSPTTDSNPFITPDGGTLIFYSEREGGFGSVDLYVTRRGADGAWSAPVNLGEEVNTRGPDYAPSLSADGKTLFFSRGPDIYAIDVAAVPALAN